MSETDLQPVAASPKAPRGKATRTGTGTRLVIVESPAKAKKIAGFLGAGYVVESSIGHIRDLPRNAADVPASHKGQAWARLGVDVDNDFETLYVVPVLWKKVMPKLSAGRAQSGCGGPVRTPDFPPRDRSSVVTAGEVTVTWLGTIRAPRRSE